MSGESENISNVVVMITLIATYRWQERRDKLNSSAVMACVPDEVRSACALNTNADYYRCSWLFFFPSGTELLELMLLNHRCTSMQAEAGLTRNDQNRLPVPLEGNLYLLTPWP
jgi:hypothetical protein